VSIYQPTHRRFPDCQQDSIRFRNLVRTVEESLRTKFAGREVRHLLEPLENLASDAAFWNHAQDGLAVLANTTGPHVFKLQQKVKEFAVVADSFHVKPLMRIVQSADRYHVLALTRESARLFVGNRYSLDAVETANGFPSTLVAALGENLTESQRRMHTSGVGAGSAIAHGQGSRKDETDKDTERYFREVDRAVANGYSKPTGLPLILAALPEHQPVFRAVSQNAALLPVGVTGNPEAMTPEQLREAVWKAVEPQYLARLAALSEAFTTAAAHQKGTADLSDAARAAVEGRVGTLLVEADRVIPGRLDVGTGAIAPATLSEPDVCDLLDDLAETVLRTGGEVVVVPAERMPVKSGLAVTYRY
jgi:hypothetical protein